MLIKYISSAQNSFQHKMVKKFNKIDLIFLQSLILVHCCCKWFSKPKTQNIGFNINELGGVFYKYVKT